MSDHVLTRSVRDSAALLDAVSGPAVGDPYCAPTARRAFLAEVGAPVGRLRIAVSTQPRDGQQVDPAWATAAEDVAALLQELGHSVEEATPAGLTDPAYETGMAAVYPGVSAWIRDYWCRRVGRPPADGEIEPQTRAYFEHAETVTAADYLTGLQQLQQVSRKVAEWFQTYDVWITPTLGAGPPPLGELVGTESDPLRGSRNAGRYLMFDGELANVTGNPAMSVPFGFDHRGLPIGIHVLGRFGDEATLFRLAAQLEQAAPWAHHRPPC